MSLISSCYSKCSKCANRSMDSVSSKMRCWNAVRFWTKCCCNSGRM